MRGEVEQLRLKSQLMQKLIDMTNDDKLVWSDCSNFSSNPTFRAGYCDLSFQAVSDSMILEVHQGIYNTSRLRSDRVEDLILIIKRQLTRLSPETKSVFMATMRKPDQIRSALETLNS